MSCLGCTNREVGCHAKCQDYLSRREAQMELNAKRRQDNDLRASVSDAQWNGYYRTNLNKKRKRR